MNSWLTISIAIGVTTLAHAATAQDTPEALGKRLFNGELPLVARLRHSTDPMPSSAVTCANCHQTGCEAGQVEPQAPPTLGPNHLLAPLKRISGPPVAYDQAAFCRILETGLTPSHTLSARLMPQYQIEPAHCAALWEYLTGDTHGC